MNDQRQQHRAYTLLELLISSAITSVLTAGLASSLYVASQSLDVADGEWQETRQANRVLAELHRDAQSATSFSELTATSVTMTVPDRNGDNVPETIRYAWSGTAGAPLTYQSNGGTVENVATNVQAFSLAYLSRFIEGISNLPRVLFVSGQAADGDGGIDTPTAAEQLRIDLIESWGYDVQTISQQASQATFNAALEEANVAFVSGQVNSGTLSTKLNVTAVGVVTESAYNAVSLGIMGSTVYTFYQSTNKIQITDASHFITQDFTTGPLQVFETNQDVKMLIGVSNLAPATNVLAEVDQLLPYPTFVTIDADEELFSGDDAAGRRVLLPWGDNGFDFTKLNDDGQTLLKRAIQWASGEGANSPDGIKYKGFSEDKLTSRGRDLKVDKPAGTEAGDLLVAAIAVDGDVAPDLTLPGGWTLLHVDDHEGITFGVWMKLATSSEPNRYEFDWSGSNNEEAYGWIMRFTGHDPTNPINALNTDNGKSTDPESPAVTTTLDKALILRLGAFDSNKITTDDTGIADHTTITMDHCIAASGGAAYQMLEAAGDSGVANFKLKGDKKFITVTIAIAPDTTGGTP